jgi:hypothetical protein
MLLHSSIGSGKRYVIDCISRCLCLNSIHIDTVSDLWTEVAGTMAEKVKQMFDRGCAKLCILFKCYMCAIYLAMSCSPCILHIRNVHMLGKDANTGEIG